MSGAVGGPAAASGPVTVNPLKAKAMQRIQKVKRTSTRGTGSAHNLRGDGGNGP
jgi:hypothetical protein